jgi:hypothetical protein
MVVLGAVAGCLVAPSITAADAPDTRWRLSKFDDGTAMLAVTDTNEATDLQCQPKSGYVSVIESNMQAGVRSAIANLILNDGYPTVELEPGPERSVIEAITSLDNGGWGYRFQIGAEESAFTQFKKTGYLKFKIGSAAVQAGIDAGFDKIAEFQAICRRPSR